MKFERRIDKILKKVEKPARYIGMEQNSIIKHLSKCDVKFAFAFPDVYEVGMSHLGLQILYFLMNSVENYACERVFAPWTDMEALMREENVALYTLETKTPVKEFDFFGFTLQYEMSYTNILNMLDLAGIAIYSKDRGEDEPIVIAGGPCAYNPEPIAPFVDIFVLGEGEEVNLEILALYERMKKNGKSRDEFLEAALLIDGVYIPKFYEECYNEDGTLSHRISLHENARSIITKRRVENLDAMYSIEKMIVPYIETVHDRIVLEMFRGCTHGCRFCQAGMIYRPIREKSVDKLVELSDSIRENTGYQEVSLASLSSCDYTGLRELIGRLMSDYEHESVAVSLPSLRIDTFAIDVLREIEKVRKTGITLAPEAGSQRMRDVINKGVNEEQLEKAVRAAFDYGWSRIKLYFMIGLPTETDEDVLGIRDVAYKVKDIFFDREKEKIVGNLSVTASASCFVPKPFTPFQWFGQNDIEEFFHKINILKGAVKDPKVKLNYHDPYTSHIEAIIARGDRKIADGIYNAWKNGQHFDGWSEYFNYDKWIEAFAEAGIDIEFYANRERDLNEVLPWDFIDIGVTKKFLWKEWERSQKEILTPDCRRKCNGCGIADCPMWEVFNEA